MLRQRYAQRYALLALCLAGVMPFCTRKIYLNTLYLARFCMQYCLFRSFLHEKRRFFVKKLHFPEKKRITRKRKRLVCIKQPIVCTYQPI